MQQLSHSRVSITDKLSLIGSLGHASPVAAPLLGLKTAHEPKEMLAERESRHYAAGLHGS